jgi:hypothetical protein
MLWTAPPLARECHGGTKFVQCMSLFMADFVAEVAEERGPLCLGAELEPNLEGDYADDRQRDYSVT